MRRLFITQVLLCAALSFAQGGKRTIDPAKVVDLTYAFDQSTIYWPTAQPFEWKKEAWGKNAKGWWYTAGLPGGKRIVSCVTDADLAHHLELNKTEEWQKRLAAAPVVNAVVRECKPSGALVAKSAGSRRLEPPACERWLAVGDAASRFDPLSSQGIFKALRSGVFASYAIGDWLTRSDDAGLRRYCRYVAKEFESYCETRAKYYSQEQRWPTSEFWLRRRVRNAA